MPDGVHVHPQVRKAGGLALTETIARVTWVELELRVLKRDVPERPRCQGPLEIILRDDDAMAMRCERIAHVRE